jgi:hypothetical protein
VDNFRWFGDIVLNFNSLLSLPIRYMTRPGLVPNAAQRHWSRFGSLVNGTPG